MNITSKKIEALSVIKEQLKQLNAQTKLLNEEKKKLETEFINELKERGVNEHIINDFKVSFKTIDVKGYVVEPKSYDRLTIKSIKILNRKAA